MGAAACPSARRARTEAPQSYASARRSALGVPRSVLPCSYSRPLTRSIRRPCHVRKKTEVMLLQTADPVFPQENIILRGLHNISTGGMHWDLSDLRRITRDLCDPRCQIFVQRWGPGLEYENGASRLPGHDAPFELLGSPAIRWADRNQRAKPTRPVLSWSSSILL